MGKFRSSSGVPSTPEVSELMAILLGAIIIALVILLGFGPLGLYFIFKPFAVVLSYWDKVSITFGLIMLAPIIKISMGLDQ